MEFLLVLALKLMRLSLYKTLKVSHLIQWYRAMFLVGTWRRVKSICVFTAFRSSYPSWLGRLALRDLPQTFHRNVAFQLSLGQKVAHFCKRYITHIAQNIRAIYFCSNIFLKDNEDCLFQIKDSLKKKLIALKKFPTERLRKTDMFLL